MRADLALVEAGLVSTRSKALQYIEAKQVYYGDKLVLKASEKVKLDGLKLVGENQFVSRGALKLKKAFEEFNLSFHDLTMADIGASTGGFTDFALSKGAKKIYAIDVGIDQLDPKLKNDPRVIECTGVNIKHPFVLQELVDFIVADLSFISLTKVLVNVGALMKPGAFGVILIKPQFEVGPDSLGKNGIVKDAALHRQVCTRIKDFLQDHHFKFLAECESPIKGKSGNTEFLFYIQKCEDRNDECK